MIIVIQSLLSKAIFFIFTYRTIFKIFDDLSLADRDEELVKIFFIFSWQKLCE
jgi:hypothetical protein